MLELRTYETNSIGFQCIFKQKINIIWNYEPAPFTTLL